MKVNSNIDRRFYEAIEAKFVTLPKEELILVQRKHWDTFVFPIIATVIAGIILVIGCIMVYSFTNKYPLLLLLTTFSIAVFVSTLAIRSISDWYFNFYIVTNKKIIEVSFRPMLSREINAVLLDQVKCTEIDTKIDGLLNDLLDIGDVVITFDRPTHQEEFRFTHVHDPKKIENYLQNMLSTSQTYNEKYYPSESIWYTKRGGSKKEWIYNEKITPVSQETILWSI
jgi:hypothetical protein